MMKKWTVLLLALALCGSLAACGGNTQPAEDAAEDDKETVETVKPEDETDKQDDAQKDDGDTPTSDQSTSAETDKGSTSSAGSSGTGGGTSGSTGSASSGNTLSNAGSGTTAPSTGGGFRLYRRLCFRAGERARLSEFQKLFAQLHG